MATEQLAGGRAVRFGTRLPGPPRWAAWTFDVAVIIGLTAVAYAMRHGGLPTDGLWFDDSWVAAGAIHGHLSNIMTVGSGHPGFTAVLMAWHDLGSGSLHSLALPALAMGTITPAVLFLSLRSFGYRRAICALLASVAVVAGIDILYSGRVKPYTFDPVLVLCIGVAIPRLASRSWRWPLAIGWVLAAIVLGSFSGYILVATAAAGVVLFLHPNGDRLIRGVALGVQAAAQLVFYEWAQRSTDLTGIEDVLRTTYDAHLHFYANPISFASEIIDHIARIAWIYPGSGGLWLKIGGLLAVTGLVVASTRSNRRNELLPARYLGLMLVLALVGALAGKFPFGPTYDSFLSPGSRYNLWALPAMAFGLAALLQRARGLVGRHDVLARAFDVALLAVAVVVLVAGYRTPQGYPFPGSTSATRFVDAQLGPNDAVMLPGPSLFAYADASRQPVTVIPTPDRQVGFTLHFADPRVQSTGYWGEIPQTPESIRTAVGNAERVFIPGYGAYGRSVAETLAEMLEPEGYRAETFTFGADSVVVLQR